MSFQVIFQSSHRSCIVLHLASLILCGSDSFCFEILKERRWLAGAGSVLPLSPLFSLLRPSAKQKTRISRPAGHVFVATGRAPLLLRRRYAGHTQLALHTQVGVGPVVDSPVGTDDRARTQSAGRGLRFNLWCSLSRNSSPAGQVPRHSPYSSLALASTHPLTHLTRYGKWPACPWLASTELSFTTRSLPTHPHVSIMPIFLHL
jgi:hypothetical protein